MQPTFGNSETQRIYQDWRDNPRWRCVTRPYQAEDVVRLRGKRSPLEGKKAGAQGLWSTLSSLSSEHGTTVGAVFEEALIPTHSDDLAKTFANAQRIIAAGHAAAVLDTHSIAAEPVPHLVAARLATDVHDTPLVLMARVKAAPGDTAVAFACAPYADVIWYETPTFDAAAAKYFIEAVHRLYPHQLVVFSCPAGTVTDSGSSWQEELRAYGYCDAVATVSEPRAAEFTEADVSQAASEIEELIAHALERGASRDLSGETFCDETAEKDLI